MEDTEIQGQTDVLLIGDKLKQLLLSRPGFFYDTEFQYYLKGTIRRIIEMEFDIEKDLQSLINKIEILFRNSTEIIEES